MDPLKEFAMYYIAPALSAGLLFFCMGRLFPLRARVWVIVLCALLVPLGNVPKLIWGVFSMESNLVRALFFPILSFVFPLALFCGSVWKRLTVNMLLYACQMLGEASFTLLLLGPEGVRDVSVEQFVEIAVPYVVITLSIDAAASCAVVFFARALTLRRFSPVYLSAMLFPLSLMGVTFAGTTGDVASWFWTGSVVLGLVSVGVLTYCLASIEDRQRLEQELRETRHTMELEQAHYRAVEERQEELARIRHDFKNQLAAVSALLQADAGADARRMIGDLSRAIDATRENLYSPIPVVNAILAEKERLCREKGIALSVDLQLCPDLPVEPLHLCSLFANLLDNAVRAAGASGAEHPAISVRSRREGDYLFVKVENPSLPPAPPREGRGTGTRILADLTKRYGGEYCGEYRGGVFTAVASLALAPEEGPGRALGEASS